MCNSIWKTRLCLVEASLLAGYAAWLGPVTTSLPPGRASEFAVRTSGLVTGAPFRQSDLDRAVDRLLSRDLYARVEPPLVHVTAALDTVGVHLPIVARRKTNRAQVVLGLSRREEGGSRVSGQVDLDLPNLAGTGRALAVGWRDDGNGTSRFGFALPGAPGLRHAPGHGHRPGQRGAAGRVHPLPLRQPLATAGGGPLGPGGGHRLGPLHLPHRQPRAHLPHPGPGRGAAPARRSVPQRLDRHLRRGGGLALGHPAGRHHRRGAPRRRSWARPATSRSSRWMRPASCGSPAA